VGVGLGADFVRTLAHRRWAWALACRFRILAV